MCGVPLLHPAGFLLSTAAVFALAVTTLWTSVLRSVRSLWTSVLRSVRSLWTSILRSVRSLGSSILRSIMSLRTSVLWSIRSLGWIIGTADGLPGITRKLTGRLAHIGCSRLASVGSGGCPVRSSGHRRRRCVHRILIYIVRHVAVCDFLYVRVRIDRLKLFLHGKQGLEDKVVTLHERGKHLVAALEFFRLRHIGPRDTLLALQDG